MQFIQLTPKEVKLRRSGLGLSDVGLAELLDVAPATVRRWEEGKTRIPLMLDGALREIERWHALDRLKIAIAKAEEEADGVTAKVVKIPLRLAIEFVGWEAKDWMNNSGGWLSRKRCGELSKLFFDEGAKAIEHWGLDALPEIRVAHDIKDNVDKVEIVKYE